MLAGRERELEILNELIGDVQKSGAAIVVLGEPGIGKSSLLRAAADSAREASLQVLLTTGVEAEAQLPFGGLHQMLRPVLGTAEALPATQRRALAAAFGADDEQRPEPFMIALAALNLLAEAAAERPLLLVADDVQWLDQPSQDVLTFIARRVTADPIVLIASVRKGHHVALVSAGLTELDVQGLDDTSARAVLAEYFPELTGLPSYPRRPGTRSSSPRWTTPTSCRRSWPARPSWLSSRSGWTCWSKRPRPG
jgi:predicted ATPase